MEFWAELLTEESWKKLIELKKEFRFILIGGWAAYLHAGLHKSKNIDIIVDYNTLKELSTKYDLSKNNTLKKYEIKFEKFDIDIYVPYFSKLTIPLEDLEEQTVMIQGIKTLKAESLLILKQGAEIDRRNSIKGEKDSIDILSIMLRSELNWKEYMKLLKKYKKENLKNELINIIKKFSDKNIHYLNINFKKFKDWKNNTIPMLKKLH